MDEKLWVRAMYHYYYFIIYFYLCQYVLVQFINHNTSYFHVYFVSANT